MDNRSLNSLRIQMDKVLSNNDSDLSHLLNNLSIDGNTINLPQYAWYPTLFCTTELNTSSDTSCARTLCGGRCSAYEPDPRNDSNTEPTPSENPHKPRSAIALEGIRNPF